MMLSHSIFILFIIIFTPNTRTPYDAPSVRFFRESFFWRKNCVRTKFHFLRERERGNVACSSHGEENSSALRELSHLWTLRRREITMLAHFFPLWRWAHSTPQILARSSFLSLSLSEIIFIHMATWDRCVRVVRRLLFCFLNSVQPENVQAAVCNVYPTFS